jgi:outer membrane protein, heavy metal efflux system
MSIRVFALISLALLMSGCRTPPLDSIDQSVAAFVGHPWDVSPATSLKPVDSQPSTSDTMPTAAQLSQDGPRSLGPVGGGSSSFGDSPGASPKPVEPPPRADSAGPRASTPSQGPSASGSRTSGVVLASYTQGDTARPAQTPPALSMFELTIPPEIPGSEMPLVRLPADRAKRPEAVAALFPELPPLSDEPAPLPGPDGRPYTLADLQRIAAANNPALRQAASDIEAARGLMIQAGLYPNPTLSYGISPNANNTASTTQGIFIDQVIKTGGKLKLGQAAALTNLRAAELAFKRARSDLATTIRGDYYTLLVAKETLRVNKGLVRFTDEIFKLQADLLAGGFAAPHEPAALRSQAFTVRLAYRQSIASYIYAWKELVADLGLKQLPLSQVEGQVDRLIPYYDYDAVLARVLRNHTDVITARYNLEGARYSLKGNQVTPVPDVEVIASLWKEQQILPNQNYFQFVVSVPIAIWDRNQGNIRNASAALVRAAEQPHAVEVNLTTNLASAYANYKTNLAAVEYYRKNILPDQVIYYRGVFERRKIDPGAAFGDLVQAQQTLVADVNAYLGILGTLWSSVVGVADFLQTDDLFQVAGTLELPQLPDFDALHPLPCPHGEGDYPANMLRRAPAPGPGPNPSTPPDTMPIFAPTPAPNTEATTPPTPTTPAVPSPKVARPSVMGAATLFASAKDPGQPVGGRERRPLVQEQPLVTPIVAAVFPIEQLSEPVTPAISRRFSAASF